MWLVQDGTELENQSVYRDQLVCWEVHEVRYITEVSEKNNKHAKI